MLDKLLKTFRQLWILKGSVRSHRLKQIKSPELEIVEGAESTWYYHLRRRGATAALCGNTRVMPTQIPLSYWGQKADHIPESYCSECAAMRLEQDANHE